MNKSQKDDELYQIILEKEKYLNYCLQKLYHTNKHLNASMEENILLKKQLQENHKVHVQNILDIVNNADIMLKESQFELRKYQKTLGAEALSVDVKIKLRYYFNVFDYSNITKYWYINDVKHIRIVLQNEKKTYVDLIFRYLNDLFEYIVEDEKRVLYKITII